MTMLPTGTSSGNLDRSGRAATECLQDVSSSTIPHSPAHQVSEWSAGRRRVKVLPPVYDLSSVDSGEACRQDFVQQRAPSTHFWG